MKIYATVSWVALSAALLSGCSSTGGTIAGLLPVPKMTKGDLSNGVYTSKDKKFSVNTPFSPGSSSYTYMEIQEGYMTGESHIVFSSSVKPAEVYRVDVLCDVSAQPGPKTADELGSLVRDQYMKKFSAAYSTPLIPAQVAGALPKEINYVQVIPERTSGLQKIQSFTVQHVTYALQGGDCLANLWVNFPRPKKEVPNDAEGRKAEFLRSFKFL